MAGLYIHVPFCKKACHYCNFHFSTNLALKTEILSAINSELILRKKDISEKLDTIYLGGGTPSLMNQTEITNLFDCIYTNYNVSTAPEITMEANPDDLTKEKLLQLYDGPINRLSIGLQSFYEQDLIYMNRSHNATQAEQCVLDALNVGFENISVDLIYGSPTTSNTQWQSNVDRVIDFGLPHISCYALTVEPKTALDHFIKTGKMAAPVDEQISKQFELLMEACAEKGYEHYEISNFAKDGAYSQHNTSYWQNKEYLGIGPGAHSYNGKRRLWNIANNPAYLKAIMNWRENADFNPEGHLYDYENLSIHDKYNEYVMTGFRTIWGVSLKHIEDKFSPAIKDYFIKSIKNRLLSGEVVENNGVYTLNKSGKLQADGIAAELFMV